MAAVKKNGEQVGVFDIDHLPNQVQRQQVVWLAPEEWPLQLRALQATDRIMLDKAHHKTFNGYGLILKPHRQSAKMHGRFGPQINCLAGRIYGFRRCLIANKLVKYGTYYVI